MATHPLANLWPIESGFIHSPNQYVDIINQNPTQVREHYYPLKNTSVFFLWRGGLFYNWLSIISAMIC